MPSLTKKHLTAWRERILRGGGAIDTLAERRRFNTALRALRAGARQCTKDAKSGRCRLTRTGEDADPACEVGPSGRCRLSKPAKKPAKKEIKKKTASPLNEKQQKWCRCVLHVANNQSSECLRDRDWKRKGCYDPYRTCARTVGTTAGRKKCDYDFERVVDAEEGRAYLDLHHAKYDAWARAEGRPLASASPSAADLNDFHYRDMSKQQQIDALWEELKTLGEKLPNFGTQWSDWTFIMHQVMYYMEPAKQRQELEELDSSFPGFAAYYAEAMGPGDDPDDPYEGPLKMSLDETIETLREAVASGRDMVAELAGRRFREKSPAAKKKSPAATRPISPKASKARSDAAVSADEKKLVEAFGRQTDDDEIWGFLMPEKYTLTFDEARAAASMMPPGISVVFGDDFSFTKVEQLHRDHPLFEDRTEDYENKIGDIFERNDQAVTANVHPIIRVDRQLVEYVKSKSKMPKGAAAASSGGCRVPKVDALPAGFKPMLAESYGTIRDGKLEKSAKLKKAVKSVDGWYASEKFDGYRSIWTGSHFISRRGNTFEVPPWMKELMPSEPLDGELFQGRCQYEACGIFRRANATDEDWRNVSYMVFDLPTMDAPFEERMARLREIVKERCACMAEIRPGVVARCPLVFAEQTQVSSEREAVQMFEAITKAGGEGIMLRKPGSAYSQRRTRDLLKIKVEDDMECVIKGTKDGKGKYAGMLGSYQCALLDDEKKKFFVSGMDDAQRKKPLPIGTVITITYNDKTKNGIPRHPRFLRVRADDK